MNDEYEINPLMWFAERELVYPPAHFTPTTTQLTNESKQWVKDYLVGRYAVVLGISEWQFGDSIGYISFEDPREATIFELKWS